MIKTKLALGTLLLTSSWIAHGALNLDDKLPLDPNLKIGTLPNGLTYYIKQNGKPEHRVELRLVVKAGSILEDDDQQGLAHFAEHMAFDGSAHFQKHDLISYLQTIGVQFGADLNAYTSFDETVYKLPIPTDNPNNLETGFQVLEDWAHGVSYDDAAIDAERPIVLEEERLGKGAQERMMRKMLPITFNGSRYAERLPIGKADILKTFPHDVLRRFYADWYRPDLMAVMVVGDVDPALAEQAIRAHFAQLANPVHERPRDYAPISNRLKPTGFAVSDAEATTNNVSIRYAIEPVKPELTIGDYRDHMVRDLIAAMLNQRLQDLTQKAAPPFLGASSGVGMVVRGYEAYSEYATPGRGGAVPAITAMVEENERARRFGFTADELERARKVMLHDFERMAKERDKTESHNYVEEYIRNFLTQEPLPGIAAENQYARQLLPGVTLEEINRAARAIIPGGNDKLVLWSGSNRDKDAIPDGPQLLAAADKAQRAEIAATAQKALPTSLMAQAPKPGTIVAQSRNAELGTTTLTLSNGVKVILKPSDFKNDEVLLGASRHGGESLYGEKDMYTVHYANSVGASMGVGDFSPTDLKKVLAGKTARLNTSSSMYSDSLNGNAASADVESLLQLLYLRMTSPRRDDVLFKAYREKAQESVKNALANPDYLFWDDTQDLVFGHHPRRQRVARPEDFDKIDLDRAMAILAQRFGSAKDLTFILVGSFDAEKVKPLLATYLGSLPVGPVEEQYRDIGLNPVRGVHRQDFYLGRDPKSNISLAFTGPATWSQLEADRFYMMIDILNIKLIEVLREKMSLIYGGGMGGAMERAPSGHYAIGSYLPCAPENVDKVIAATLAEIEKLQTEGPQQADIDKVKQNWRENDRINLRTNSHWMTRLEFATLNGDDPAEFLHLEKRIDTIDAAQLREAARRYFDLKNYVQTVKYPEKATEKVAQQ